jgi:soluble lytic murein transglycosylase-like protein
MRHGITGIVILATMCANVSCYAFEASYDDLESGHFSELKLPNSHFEMVYLETASVNSEHLKRYDLQDTERRHISRLKEAPLPEYLTDRPSGETAPSQTRIRIGKRYNEDIFRVSQEYNIDPLLLHAIAEVESDYNARAVSRAGAQGLMQVMPDTARRFGMTNPEQELFDPISNLRVSSNYIRSLHHLFGNNIPLILAAYNAGENAVIRYGYTIPPYKETKKYVNKVMERYLQLKSESHSM